MPAQLQWKMLSGPLNPKQEHTMHMGNKKCYVNAAPGKKVGAKKPKKKGY